MYEGRRPGGLTALAVLNFVFGGFDAFGFAGSAIMLATGYLPPLPEEEGPPPRAISAEEPSEDAPGSEEAEREQAERRREAIRAIRLELKLGLADGLLAGLLIASGVGYLKQRRVLGRHLGNAYAACSIVATVLGLVLLRSVDVPGSWVTPLHILLLIYPIATLALLNTTFKEDFVH